MTLEDSALYRDITDFAHATPPWVQQGAGIWTEAGLLVLVALFAAAWWRARRDSPGRSRSRPLHLWPRP